MQECEQGPLEQMGQPNLQPDSRALLPGLTWDEERENGASLLILVRGRGICNTHRILQRQSLQGCVFVEVCCARVRVPSVLLPGGDE